MERPKGAELVYSKVQVSTMGNSSSTPRHYLPDRTINYNQVTQWKILCDSKDENVVTDNISKIGLGFTRKTISLAETSVFHLKTSQMVIATLFMECDAIHIAKQEVDPPKEQDSPQTSDRVD